MSVRRLLALSRGFGADVVRWAELTRSVQSDGSRERLRAASAAEPALAELMHALETAPSHDAGIAEINDRALELDRCLDVGRGIPGAASRIALFTGTASAIIVMASSGANPGELGTSLASFGAGLFGGLASAWIGRMASERAREQREAWGRLGRALERAVPDRQ